MSLSRSLRRAFVGAIAAAALLAAAAPGRGAESPEYYETIDYLLCDSNWDDDFDDRSLVWTNYAPGYGARLAANFKSLAQSMAESGIVYDVSTTEFYQGVTSGGVEQGFEFGGKVDQFLNLDSGKLGLWEGMTMSLHAETRFGEDVNRTAVGLAPVNVAMLYPAEEHVTAITNLTFTQALSEEWLVSFGKFNGVDMFYQLYPETGRGVDGFMNATMVIPLALLRTFPLSFLGANITKMHGTQIEASVTVFDPHDCATTTGFDNLGDNGANIIGMYRLFAGTEELPGSHMFGFVGATGDYTSLDPASFVFVPGQGIVASQQTGSWAALYILQQRLWQDQRRANRNVGVLSQWCIADEETCPFQWTGNLGVQAHGLFADRLADRAGVGYFYTGLSDEFQTLVSQAIPLHDLHGVELYYNAQVTKCFYVTADLQVLEPAEIDNDTAVVFGLRGHIGL